MFAAVLVLLFSFHLAELTDPSCVIDLTCEECVPDNMPLVTSPRAADGALALADGAELRLDCGGGRFLLYPERASLAAVCEAGRWRVPEDAAPRHLLDLACQESVFEDVLHDVEHCGAGLEGRAYQMRSAGGGVRHLATLCFEPSRVLALRLRASSAGRVALAPHRERAGPLSLLGNFNHMFDARAREEARQLYSDEARLQRRLEQRLRPDGPGLAGQSLAAARLLAPAYLPALAARAADFPSNRVASWRSVVDGNLRLLQEDVADLMRRREVEVYAGTHGAWAPTPGAEGVRLKAGRRFPVPRYIWTVVAGGGRGAALVLLNDPLVRVSEIRTAVFCESSCSSLPWLTRLRRHRSYERPAAGLVFCCSLAEFTAKVAEMPAIFNGSVPLLI